MLPAGSSLTIWTVVAVAVIDGGPSEAPPIGGDEATNCFFQLVAPGACSEAYSAPPGVTWAVTRSVPL